MSKVMLIILPPQLLLYGKMVKMLQVLFLLLVLFLVLVLM